MKAFTTLAANVARSMQDDGIANQFANATKAQKIKIALAYAENERKKIEQIQNRYMTNPEARKSLQLSVLSMIREKSCNKKQ